MPCPQTLPAYTGGPSTPLSIQVTTVENFTSEKSLSANWIVNGPAAVAEVGYIAANTGTSPPTPASIITPTITFSSMGLGIGTPSGSYQGGGIQSVSSFTGPFTVTATGIATSINAGVLQLAISTQNGGEGVEVGGSQSACCTPFTYQVSSGPGTHWASSSLSSSPLALNQPYTFTISDAMSGAATVSVSSDGTTLGQATTSVGTGPFYVILSQAAGAYSSGNPSQAYWSSIEITEGSTASPSLIIYELAGGTTLPVGNLAGSSPTIVSGTDTTSILSLQNNSGYIGVWYFDPVTVQLNTNASLGSAPLIMNGGSILQANAANLSFNNTLALANSFGVTNTIDTHGNILAWTGLIADGIPSPSSLTVTDSVGGGALILTNANTYSGGTDLTGGTLVVGNNSALGTGTLAMSAGTTLSFLNTGNFTLANNITISGDPFFAPPAGTVQTIAGVIADGASPGTLEMSGAGTLVLSAINTYTGTTNVNSGTLEVDGSIASSSLTSVNNGASLIGAGTVGNAQINSGGLFAPGTVGVPGTFMMVSGNLALQSGALYLVQVNPMTSTFADVTGTASLGGNVFAAFAPGSYVMKQYDILHSGGLEGTFAGVTTANLPTGFTVNLSYTATDVFLQLNASLPLVDPPVNQQNVANALDNFFNSGGTLPPRLLAIFNLTGASLTNSLSQLDGEASTGTQRDAFQITNQFLSTMLDPFVTGRIGSAGGEAIGFTPEQQASFPPDIATAYASVLKTPPATSFTERWTAWGSSFGASGVINGNASTGTNNLTTADYGFAAGMDYHFTADTLAGFALAGGGTSWDLAQGLGGGRSDAFQIGVYGKNYRGPAYVAAALAFTNNWFTTDRTALGDQLQASFSGQSYGGRLETGYRFSTPISGSVLGATPYAAMQTQWFHTPTYSETDLAGGGLGLTYNAMTANDTRSELGLRFDEFSALGNGMPLVLRARLAWAHDWITNPSLDAVFQSLPGASFVVNGATPPTDSALVSAGAELHMTASWSLAAKFDGEFANGSQTYGGSGTLRYTW